MHRTSFLKNLQILDATERNAFRQFVRSPYFNDGPNAPRLARICEVLCDVLDLTDAEAVEQALHREQVWAAVFPDVPFQNGRFNNLVSEAGTLLRAFATQRFWDESGREDVFRQRQAWARLLKNRGDAARFEEQVQKAADALETDAIGFEFFKKSFDLEWEKYDFANRQNEKKSDSNLVNTLRSLDIFYLANKLHLAAQLRLHQRVLQVAVPPEVETSISGTLELLKILQENQLPQSAFLSILEKILRFLDNLEIVTEAAFDELLELMHAHSPHFEPELQRDLYAYARTICAARYNAESQSGRWLERLFGLFEHIWQHDLLAHEGKIPMSWFQNFVRTGLKLGRTEAVAAFVFAPNIQILGDTPTSDYLRYNRAEYFFAIKDFTAAIDNLEPHYGELAYNLTARRLRLKIRYETNALLDTDFDAFRMFISGRYSRELSAAKKELNLNFLKILKSLHLYQQRLRTPNAPPNERRVEKIATNIRQVKLLAEREWLLEKAIELEGVLPQMRL